MIRAKFECQKVVKESYGEVVDLQAVYSEDGDNKSWSEATPAGSLNMVISNEAAQGLFEEGKRILPRFHSSIKENR